MKNFIVITGGAGFVGANLISLLLKKTKFWQMKSKQLIIKQYQTEFKKGYLPEAIAILLEAMEQYQNDTELIQLLSELRTDYLILTEFKDAQISTIQGFKEKATNENYTNLILFETEWWSNFGFGGRNTSWEILSEALIKDPENDALLNAIEELNDCVDDAPTFADGMETIGQEVAKGTFPRDVFDYLVLALADPDYPDYFELAEEIADKKV